MADSVGVHLFSSGFEWDNWEARNCDRCVKQSDCDLQDAFFLDSLDHGLPDGNVTLDTADRAGYSDEYIGVLGWPCKERTTEPVAPSGPAPAVVEMRKAGAAMLPGFGPAPAAATAMSEGF